MAKTIHELAIAYGKEHQGTVNIEDFEAGANAVLEMVEKELMRAFLEDFDGFSDYDRELAQGVLGQMKIFLVQLKG